MSGYPIDLDAAMMPPPMRRQRAAVELQLADPIPVRRTDPYEDHMTRVLTTVATSMETLDRTMIMFDKRLAALESRKTVETATGSVWPSHVYINGCKIKCNYRSRDPNDNPEDRAVACCEQLIENGIRPSYKALRACHFGSSAARKALQQYELPVTPIPPSVQFIKTEQNASSDKKR